MFSLEVPVLQHLDSLGKSGIIDFEIGNIDIVNYMLIYNVSEKGEFMGNYQHRILTDMDETGFGIKYETDMSIYTPRHWHKALELLLL